MPDVPNPALPPVRVKLPDERSYLIRIGSGMLGVSDTWDGSPTASTAVIVTNDTIAPLYLESLRRSLAKRYARVEAVVLPDGEEFKDWSTLSRIFDHLLAQALDRKTVLFALGGGVIGDMTGFAAAIYMRGIPFVQVPTTLLAQVDSSVGGKTAINHPSGKNMIGAFYQPSLVVADTEVLNTLPDREYRSGLAEVIKYGPIADAAFLDWLESNLDALMARDADCLAWAIRRSCEIKAWVVEQDEKEQGLRAILNFGHTFGHAIEAGLGYGEWLHGEAVACGMVLAAKLSHLCGLMPADFPHRMTQLIHRCALPIRLPPLRVDRYLELMRVDKKNEAGSIRYVLIESLGKACIRAVPDDVVEHLMIKNGAIGRE